MNYNLILTKMDIFIEIIIVICINIKQFSIMLKTMNLLVYLKRTNNRKRILCLTFKNLFVNRIIQ